MYCIWYHFRSVSSFVLEQSNNMNPSRANQTFKLLETCAVLLSNTSKQIWLRTVIRNVQFARLHFELPPQITKIWSNDQEISNGVMISLVRMVTKRPNMYTAWQGILRATMADKGFHRIDRQPNIRRFTDTEYSVWAECSWSLPNIRQHFSPITPTKSCEQRLPTYLA